MKRVLGSGLAGALVLLAGAAAYVELAGIPSHPVQPPALQVNVTPERVARGKKLATLLCVGCHQDPTTGLLTGKHLIDVPAKFGAVYSANITRDAAKGAGGWTDGELAFLLRTGIARDGRYIPPWMIKLPHMSDEDLASIIAFLRSDDALVAPVSVDPPGRSRPSFLTKLLCRVAFKPIPYPEQPIAAPPVSDKVAHGRYLVAGLDCYGCHSASWETMNIPQPERSGGFLGGGNELVDLRGKPLLTPNLTPDEETGIGRWSEQDFTRALKEGFRPDGTPVRAPMAPMPQLSDEETSAIYAYLRTVPKIRNSVPRVREVDALPATAPEGQRLYFKYGCVSCHGESGSEGSADLRQAARHFPRREDLKAWIMDAPSFKADTRMPRWKGVIAEDEYEPLIRYVLSLGTGAPES